MNTTRLLVLVSLVSMGSPAFSETSLPSYIYSEKDGLKAATCQSVTLAQGSSYSDDVIEISEELASETHELNLQGKLLQQGGSADLPHFLRCVDEAGTHDYLQYDVFDADHEAPVAQIAVDSVDSALFKNAHRYSPEDGEILLEQNSKRTLLSPLSTASLIEGVAAVEGSHEHVVCTEGGTLNVRDQSLTRILFKANAFEKVLPVQSFGVDRVAKVIDGKTYHFVNVQFPSHSNKLGWMAEEFLKLRSQCPGAAVVTAPLPSASGWTFPTIRRPSDSYKAGMRRFRASRSGGRLHAACDLYRVRDEAAVAVNSGTVLRDRYYFYEGTYALEIRHQGGKVVRYGEITGKAAPGVSAGKNISSGQTIGYIGKVNSGCCTPMLHFEMYSGTASGALTTSGNQFRRRRDLLDPTSYLTDWEKAKFGQSY